LRRKISIPYGIYPGRQVVKMLKNTGRHPGKKSRMLKNRKKFSLQNGWLKTLPSWKR